MLQGVVFDLDGTLLDTEKLYRRFWVEAARQMGYPMEDRHALMVRSMAAERAEPLLRREVCEDFDYHAVRALRRQIMEAYIDENGVEAKAGLLPMLREMALRNEYFGGRIDRFFDIAPEGGLPMTVQEMHPRKIRLPWVNGPVLAV